MQEAADLDDFLADPFDFRVDPLGGPEVHGTCRRRGRGKDEDDEKG
jgi:hypothetical protein